MKITTRLTWFTTFCCLLLASVAPIFAMSDADKAIWGASEKVDTSFIVPSAQGTAVMGKAQGIISQWNIFDRDMSAMKIQTVTDSLIETYNPTDIGNIGFNVTRTTLPAGDQISVSTMYYTGNIFSLGRDKKNADKRAHLLSYLLQMYAKTLSASPTPAPTATVADSPNGTSNNPNMPDESDDYLKLIRYQLSVGRYDLALSYLQNLKDAIIDKEKASSSSKTLIPTAPVVAPAATPPVVSPPPTTPAPPSDGSIKPSPSP